MSKERFVMKEQDDTCTFSTYKQLMKTSRDKCNEEGIKLKMLLNAGLISMLSKNKNDMENILKKAEQGEVI